MEFPDYRERGIVNLMGSLSLGMGGPGRGYPPLDLLPPERVAKARNLLLLVIDGLGFQFLQERSPDAWLARHLAGRLSSVAPPTTAAAVTCFLTGQAPAQHGFTGWFTWLRELGAVTTVLQFQTRHGGLDLSGVAPGPLALSGSGPLFDLIPRECHVLNPASIAFSPFSRAFAGQAQLHPYASLDEFLERIAGILAPPGRRYLYAYWPFFDYLAHDQGVGSLAARRHFDLLDAALEDLRHRLTGSDTLMVISADHGFIDSPTDRHSHLAEHPELARCLTLPLCGEPRCLFCYVRPGAAADFEAYVGSQLGERAELFHSRELVERGLFGLEPLDPRLGERVGDYTLVMRDNYLFKDRLPSEKPYHHIGVHGGFSAGEVYVPLILDQA